MTKALADPKHIYPVSSPLSVISAVDQSPAGTLTEGDWRDGLRTAAYFTGGLAIGIGLLSLAGWLALRGFRTLLRRVGAQLPGPLRHGIANLYRPGNQAQAAVVALGVGVMFTLTVFLVQNALVNQIRGARLRGCRTCFYSTSPPIRSRLSVS